MNQAIFEKFYVGNKTEVEFMAEQSFEQILKPIKGEMIQINKAAQDSPNKLSHYRDMQKATSKDFLDVALMP